MAEGSRTTQRCCDYDSAPPLAQAPDFKVQFVAQLDRSRRFRPSIAESAHFPVSTDCHLPLPLSCPSSTELNDNPTLRCPQRPPNAPDCTILDSLDARIPALLLGNTIQNGTGIQA